MELGKFKPQLPQVFVAKVAKIKDYADYKTVKLLANDVEGNEVWIQGYKKDADIEQGKIYEFEAVIYTSKYEKDGEIYESTHFTGLKVIKEVLI